MRDGIKDRNVGGCNIVARHSLDTAFAIAVCSMGDFDKCRQLDSRPVLMRLESNACGTQHAAVLSRVK